MEVKVGFHFISLEYNSLPAGPGPLMQWITRLTADPRVLSWIPARPHTFEEIDHEIIFMVVLLPLIHEGLLSVTSKSVCIPGSGLTLPLAIVAICY